MVPGLSWAQYEYLHMVAASSEITALDAVVRHCAVRRWVVDGQLSADGEAVLARACDDPPPKQITSFYRD